MPNSLPCSLSLQLFGNNCTNIDDMTQLLPAIFFLELDCFVLLQSDVKQKVITALQIVAFVYYCCNTLRLQPNKEKIFRKRSFYSSRGRFEEYIFGKGSRGGGGGGRGVFI